MNDAFYNQDQSTRSAIHDSEMDEREREYLKREELISKFANGWERYNKEPLFRTILEAMTRGSDAWEIIDKLVEMNSELARKFRILLENWPNHNYPNFDKTHP